MTCKNDCIHYDVCHRRINSIDFLPVIKGIVSTSSIMYKNCDDVEKYCRYFKDKSRIVELPNVEIGQELFYVDRYTKSVESDIVSKLIWEENDLGVDTGIWSENNGFSEYFSDIGKNLFITKEKAEAKLKELNEKCQ